MRRGNRFAWLAAGLLCGLATACGAADRAPEASPAPANPALLNPAPGDFVVLPCLGTPEGSTCAIVRAGGKSLLFGAPEGVAGALGLAMEAGTPTPDGVFLFTLEGEGTEGLLRLRNRTWIEGRQQPLPVAGPEGTPRLLGHLDKAMERADAIAYVRHRPPGKLGAALFAPVAISPSGPARVFDTGDLSVSAHAGREGQAHYAIDYGERTLLLLACPAPAAESLVARADLVLACSVDAAGRPVWPLAPPGIAVLRTAGAAATP